MPGQWRIRLDLQHAPVVLLHRMQEQGALYHQAQHVGVERLLLKIVGAHADRAQYIGAVLVTGQDNDLGVRRRAQDVAQQRQTLARAVRIGRQAQVHGHHGWLMAAQLRQRRFAPLGQQHLIVVQSPAQLLLQPRIVLHYQQFFPRHCVLPVRRRGRLKVRRRQPPPGAAAR
jgi:hypothetical protein